MLQYILKHSTFLIIMALAIETFITGKDVQYIPMIAYCIIYGAMSSWYFFITHALSIREELTESNLKFLVDVAAVAYRRSIHHVTDMLPIYVVVMLGSLFVLHTMGNTILAICVLAVYIMEVASRLLLCLTVCKLDESGS